MITIHIGKADNNYWNWKVRLVKGNEIRRYESARLDMSQNEAVEESSNFLLGEETRCKKGMDNQPKFQTIDKLWHEEIDEDMESFRRENDFS